MKVSFFWFRRDLRLHDNVGFSAALKSTTPVIPVFIFDEDILEELPENDARVQFIHQRLELIHAELNTYRSGIIVRKGKPL